MAAPLACPGVPGDIPFSRPSLDDDDLEGVTRVLRSGWLTTGDECARFEEELTAYLGGDVEVVAVSSCTAALEISLAHLALPAGSRVGVPTWTFVSSAFSAVHVGHRPVLLDVEPDTLNLSPAALEAALDEGLDAVVAVHFGGVPVAAEVHELCRAADVPLVEDAAHALGARDERGTIAGRGSAGACFSFYATKNLSSGEGGAIATDDPELAAFARSFRLHGLDRDAWARYRPGNTAQYDLVGPGYKANFPDILAALARSQLGRFDALQARRRHLLDAYRTTLATVAGATPVPAVGVAGSADHLAVVALDEGIDRTSVQKAMSEAGIGTSVHFRPLHDFAWFQDNKVPLGPTGVDTAEAMRTRVLSLPLYPDLTDDDVARVVDALAGAIG